MAVLALGVCACSAADTESAEETESAATSLVNPELPEFPAIDRGAGVQAIRNNKFTAPFLPSHRTTADGRVAVEVIMDSRVFLNVPEKLTTPFASGPAGPSILASAGGLPAALRLDKARLVGHPIAADGRVGHRTICDATPQFPAAGDVTSPVSCGTATTPMDCYRFTIVAPYHLKTSVSGDLDDWRTEVWGTPVTVKVTNPKTPNAKLLSLEYGTPVQGLTFQSTDYGDQASGPFLEPMFTSDGRLLVFRAGSRKMPWTDDKGIRHAAKTLNIVYSVAGRAAAPCDVRAFKDIRPIAYAPYDSQMKGRYGIADYPFRDPEGTPIPPENDFPGTYPWVDRAGANIMFESIAAQLHFSANGTVGTRYPARCADGTTSSCDLTPTAAELGANGTVEWKGEKRGVSIAGRWTHGKLVLLDGLVNNTDYALGTGMNKQRQIRLYTAATGPRGTESGWTNAGVGQDNDMPAAIAGQGVDANASVIDSLEQLFNYRAAFIPHSFRDVVWHVTSGHTTAEVALDEYIDPNAFIVAEMTASQTAREVAAGGKALYHDGFVTNGFTGEVRMQNAATAPPGVWNIPRYGVVGGGARAEPIAMGGIEGKGLWLDGNDGLAFDIPAAQPQDVLEPTWTISLFVDPRFGDDATSRRLLTYPDGTTLDLVGRRTLRMGKGTTTVFQTPLPGGALPAKVWSHIALRVASAGANVDVFVNGMRFARWVSPNTTRLFTMRGTRLVVGASGTAAFRGWIDDFKVLAHDVDPEHMCNVARGTLIGLPAAADATWRSTAALYPAATHTAISALLTARGKPTYPSYACFHDYSRDLAVHRSALPAGARSIRDGILFPEGPLVVDKARPDSAANSFCKTCHTATSAGGLSLEALVSYPGLAMQNDLRRQPTQPPRRIFGRLPAGFAEAGVPGTAFDAPALGFALDRWVYAP